MHCNPTVSETPSFDALLGGAKLQNFLSVLPDWDLEQKGELRAARAERAALGWRTSAEDRHNEIRKSVASGHRDDFWRRQDCPGRTPGQTLAWESKLFPLRVAEEGESSRLDSIKDGNTASKFAMKSLQW